MRIIKRTKKGLLVLALGIFLMPLFAFGGDGRSHDHAHDAYTREALGDAVDEAWNPEFLENIVIDGHYQIALTRASAPVGRKAVFTFELGDVFGGGLMLERFLEADAHLVIVNRDAGFYAHEHPVADESERASFLINRAEAHSGTNDLEHPVRTFETALPEPGVYKMFLLFRPENAEVSENDRVVATFYISASESSGEEAAETDEHFIGDGHTDHAHAPVRNEVWWKNTQWWTLFLSSLILMILLSFGVRWYLKMEPINKKQ